MKIIQYLTQGVAVAALVFASLVPVHASIVPPAIDFSLDGQSFSSADPATSIDALTGVSTISGDIQTTDFSLQYSVAADSDPFLTYGFSAVNLTGDPLAVSEHFSTPVTGGPWNASTASLSISAVPGFSAFGLLTSGGNPVAIATATESGGSVENLNVGLGGNCENLSRAGPCYALSTSSLFPGGIFTSLDVYVNFTLDGLGSAVTVNGRVDLLDPVTTGAFPPAPEAGTAALTGLGFIFLLFLTRRRDLRPFGLS